MRSSGRSLKRIRIILPSTNSRRHSSTYRSPLCRRRLTSPRKRHAALCNSTSQTSKEATAKERLSSTARQSSFVKTMRRRTQSSSRVRSLSTISGKHGHPPPAYYRWWASLTSKEYPRSCFGLSQKINPPSQSDMSTTASGRPGRTKTARRSLVRAMMGLKTTCRYYAITRSYL